MTNKLSSLFLSQAGAAESAALLPDALGGVWRAGVRRALPAHLHRHALLSGHRQRRSLPHSLHHT